MIILTTTDDNEVCVPKNMILYAREDKTDGCTIILLKEKQCLKVKETPREIKALCLTNKKQEESTKLICSRQLIQNTPYIKLEYENKSGQVTFNILSSTSTSYAKIINIYVPSDFRRKGIGTKLLEEAENKLRQYGVYNVDITFPKITNLNWIQHWLERKGYTLRNTFDSFDVCLSKRL